MLFKWFFVSFSFNIKLVFLRLYRILKNILAYPIAYTIKIILIYVIMFDEFNNNVQTVRQSKTVEVDCKESRCILVLQWPRGGCPVMCRYCRPLSSVGNPRLRTRAVI